jgi:hypothetical protein
VKKFLVYFLVVSLVVCSFWLIAGKFGISTIKVNCPPMVMDCGDAAYYSPLFWFPMRFVRSPLLSDQYVVSSWPGLAEDAAPVFASSLAYWFVLSNIFVFPIFKIISSRRKFK